jgi:cytochrome c oxidase subunit 3
MKDRFGNEYSPEVKQKTKTNLVLIICFSVFMLFAGLTSGYIVSMGDGFWVKIGLPTPFMISTAVILVSSLTLWLGTKAIKRNDKGKTKLFLSLTLLLGILFGVFQFQGYAKLVDSGAMFNTWIIVSDGRYGDYYKIKKGDSFLGVENNQYTWQGNKLEGNSLEELQSFVRQFLERKKTELNDLDMVNEYTIYFKGEPLSFVNNTLMRPNGEALKLLDYERLQFLAQNIIDSRADFFMSGEMGKDFDLYYKGKPLEYIDRTLMYNGQELSKNLQNKLLRGNKDTSTAYLYILTFLHLLHVVGGVIMLAVFVKRSFSEEYTKDNTMSVKAGVIFWHFLGGLWIYLLLFLTFIH